MIIRKSVLPLILMVAVMSLSILAILQGQTSKESPSLASGQQTPKPLLDKVKKSYPLIDYLNKSNTDASRKAKSKKYNKIEVLDPNITKDAEQVSFLDWATGLSALPVEKSQIVIIDKVVDAQASLSENEKSVYSEFKIEIEKVLKNNEQKSFEEDKYIKIERQGGIVQFPSGYKTWFFVAGQQMPVVGRRYVFFITNEFPLLGYQKNDFYLITAYELTDGRVFPLDYPSGGTHPLATLYNGKEESIFMNDLLNSLNNSSNNLPQ